MIATNLIGQQVKMIKPGTEVPVESREFIKVRIWAVYPSYHITTLKVVVAGMDGKFYIKDLKDLTLVWPKTGLGNSED